MEDLNVSTSQRDHRYESSANYTRKVGPCSLFVGCTCFRLLLDNRDESSEVHCKIVTQEELALIKPVLFRHGNIYIS